MTDDTKQCPHCAETIKAEAKICRFCGRDISVTGPVNSTPITTANQKKSGKNILLFIILGGVLSCCGIFALAAVFSNTNPKTDESILSQTDTTQNPSQPTSSQPPDIIPQVVAPSIQEILATVENMTDAQRNQYDASLQGNRVEGWRGIVSDVDEGEIFGGFSVYVEMVPDNFSSEVHIEVSKEVGLSLSKGQEIVFSGNIKSVSDILGTTVFIENAIIGPAR